MASFLGTAGAALSPRRIQKFILAHKIASAVGAIVIVFGGYFLYNATTSASGQTSYVLGTVTRGTVVSAVSASGQVSASSQIDIKPKASGDITWIAVKAGDKVRAGQALMSIDSTTAQQSVADAERSYEQAVLQFQKDSAQAPIDYQNAVDTLATASTTLATEYSNTFNTFSNAYLDLPTVMTGANNILYGYDLSGTGQQWNADVLLNMFSGDDRTALQPFADKAKSDYTAAGTKYTSSLTDYQNLSRGAPTTEIDALLAESVDTTTAVAQALQSELNFLGEVGDLAAKDGRKLSSTVSTLQSNARSYLSTTNADLSALLSEQKTLQNDKQAIKNDEQTLSLLGVGNNASGTNPLNLQISKSNLDKQAQDLANQKANLANYTVFAPFDGTIASVSARVGDSAGSTVATIISTGDIATLSLNEVDAAKLALGDKATLTFDAIDGLTLAGSVAEIDPLGTVSQGVVSYNIQIAFTAQDPSVKPGMTVNAEIQSDIAQDVLMVPASAVKTANGQSYVLAFTPPLADTGGSAGVVSAAPPQQIAVATGISDDTNVEIRSGLTEGEQIVLRTSSSGGGVSAAAAATSRTGSAGGRGGFGGGGGVILRGLGG